MSGRLDWKWIGIGVAIMVGVLGFAIFYAMSFIPQ